MKEGGGTAKLNRETRLERGFKKRKSSNNLIDKLPNLVNNSALMTLHQIKMTFENENIDLTISFTFIGRMHLNSVSLTWLT